MFSLSGKQIAVKVSSKEQFRMTVNPGRASSDELAELFLAMSELNIACGGNGLIYEVESSGPHGVCMLCKPIQTSVPC